MVVYTISADLRWEQSFHVQTYWLTRPANHNPISHFFLKLVLRQCGLMLAIEVLWTKDLWVGRVWLARKMPAKIVTKQRRPPPYNHTVSGHLHIPHHHHQYSSQAINTASQEIVGY